MLEEELRNLITTLELHLDKLSALKSSLNEQKQNEEIRNNDNDLKSKQSVTGKLVKDIAGLKQILKEAYDIDGVVAFEDELRSLQSESKSLGTYLLTLCRVRERWTWKSSQITQLCDQRDRRRYAFPNLFSLSRTGHRCSARGKLIAQL